MIFDSIPRGYYSIYVKDGDKYKEYKRIKHFFRKDKFSLIREMSVEDFKREVWRFESLCWENFYNKYLVLDE
jgi:hypothetical protein